MKFDFDSQEQETRIELIPLIDVIFCILTFFILAAVTLTRQTAINVDLPRASAGTSQMRKILIVSVDPVGQTYVEKQPVTRDQLSQNLLKFQQTNPEGKIVLYASRASTYNDVVQVLDLLKSVGGDRVALATLPSATNENNSQFPRSIPGSDGQINPFDPSQLPSSPGSLPNSSGLSDPSNFNPSSLPGLEPTPNQLGTGSKTNSSSLGLPETNSGANKSAPTHKP